MRRTLGLIAVGVVVGVAGIMGALALQQRHEPSTPPGPALGEAAEALPSDTATDWVTYADHLVTVHVTGVADDGPSQQELAAGEGLIGRTVTMQVDEKLWSRTGSPELPETLTWNESGWSFKNGDVEHRQEF
ncbi:MAG: hypothetical protein ACR2KG_10815 [Nocardioidaceae bacterium]